MGRARRWAGILATASAVAVFGAACAPSSGPTAPAGVPSCGADSTSSAILAYTNASRASSGLPALAWNGQLGCLAISWSQYLASTNGFFHRDLNAVIRSPGYGGYHTLGENILKGPASMSAATRWRLPPNPPPTP